jgi:hypothetical protein
MQSCDYYGRKNDNTTSEPAQTARMMDSGPITDRTEAHECSIAIGEAEDQTILDDSNQDYTLEAVRNEIPKQNAMSPES